MVKSFSTRSPARCRPGGAGRPPWVEHLRVRAARDRRHHRSPGVRCAAGAVASSSSRPMTRPLKPFYPRSPSSATSSTVRHCPGSKRTAVPAAMFRRKPRAAARSKSSALLVLGEVVRGRPGSGGRRCCSPPACAWHGRRRFDVAVGDEEFSGDHRPAPHTIGLYQSPAWCRRETSPPPGCRGSSPRRPPSRPARVSRVAP